MKAIFLAPFEKNSSFLDVPTPQAKEYEILVKVHASGINRLDILQRINKYPLPKKNIPGIEIAGTVAGKHPTVQRWKEGDKVIGILPEGGYAEYAILHEELAIPMPSNLSFTSAAAIPEAFLTSFQTLFWVGNTKPEDTVLIHAGASGIGTAAIQLAKSKGAHVFITASSKEKISFCKKLGADEGWNYQEEDFAQQIYQKTNGHGVNIILDFVGGSFFSQNIHALAQEGKIICIATLGGIKAEIDFHQLMQKWGCIIGTTLKTRPFSYKKKLTHDFSSYATPLFEKNVLQPVIDTIYPWEEIDKAHEKMMQNKNIGKLILTGM